MQTSSYLPGAAQPAPLLTEYAVAEARPPEDFFGALILPDVQTDQLLYRAPTRGGEELEVDDDDLIGNKTDFPEIKFSAGEVTGELGMHGRKVVIGALELEKARAAAAAAGSADPTFDLERYGTDLLIAQNERRIELLRWRKILDTTAYPADNVFDPIEIDTADNVREVLMAANKLVRAGGQGPANLMVFGDTAVEGLERNENMIGLLGDDQEKVITREVMRRLLRMPEETTRVEFNTASYRRKAKGPVIPMVDRWIWIGRAKIAPDGKAMFGKTRWMPCRENGQRFYINKVVVGVQETREIGLKNYYLSDIDDAALGVLIPVTLSTDA